VPVICIEPIFSARRCAGSRVPKQIARQFQ
jgi:hypothetical protein